MLSLQVIVVAGGMASVAAGILATLSPHLQPHHVLAVEVPAYDDQTAVSGSFSVEAYVKTDDLQNVCSSAS